MSTENTEDFESTVSFEDGPATPVPPTEADIYEQGFNEGLGEAGDANTPKPESQEVPKRFYETVTDDEFKAVFDKAKQYDALNDRVKKDQNETFGRIGSLEQSLKQISDMKPTPVPVTKDAFKHLSEYFGDDDNELVVALAQDLAQMQLGIPLMPNIDLEARFADEQSRIEQRQQEFAQQQDQLRREFEVKLVDMQHPDWREISQSDEFNGWLNTLKPDDKKTLETAWDGIVIARGISKFKDWQAKKADYETQKNQRLEANIPLNGSGGSRPQPNFDSDYQRGFDSAFKGN